MTATTFALVAAFVALGVQGFAPPAGHQYIAPGPGDVRSPCPGLNSLANHGFLNRNGKNITVAQLIAGGEEGISIGPDFMTAIGALALFSPAKPNGLSFDLVDLAEHNFPIEHDVSLTRRDYYVAHDDLTFYQPYYEEFISHFDGLTTTTLETAAQARFFRTNYSLTQNPTVVFGPEAFLFGYGESGLYTQIMGSSPLAVGAPVAYVASLFQNERLPYELGWQKSLVPITLNSLGAYALQLFNANTAQQKAIIGKEVLTAGSYRQFVADYLAITQKLHNETKN